MVKKDRIEWIDTAKGICIIFVILYHICRAYGGDYVGSDVIQAFRMPLYFILSGLFFKTYEGFGGFMKRKCNKLQIPYIFFYLTLTVIAPYLIYRISGFQLIGYANAPGLKSVVTIFSEYIGANQPIWFLVCLFEVNLLFYLIQVLGRSQWIIALLSFVGGGGIGLWISWNNLPEFWANGKDWYWLDSAFSMLPFFFFGWFLKNNSVFLY